MTRAGGSPAPLRSFPHDTTNRISAREPSATNLDLRYFRYGLGTSFTVAGVTSLAIAAEDLRIHVYDHLLQRGVPPRAAEIARHFATDEASAKEALRSLRIGKTILVHPINGEIWMAGPFAAAPTAYRVTSGSTEWFANCAWDML